jgi:hypothetical protein
MMKNSPWAQALGILALLAASTVLLSQVPAVDSVWAAQPPKLDASSKDWEGAAFSQWEKGGVQYAFRNDATNLYLLFIINDQKLRSSIEDGGLTVLVDPAGGESKDYGILFRRKRITANESIAMLEKQGFVSDEQKAKIRATPFYNYYFAEVIDKKGDAVPVPEGVAGPPVLFKFATEKKTLIFELEIPLVRPHPTLPGLGVEPGATVNLGFEWGGLTEAGRRALARTRGAQSDIANEQVTSGRETDITAGARKIERTPPKFAFWTAVKLAKPA